MRRRFYHRYLRCTFSTENSRPTPWHTTQLSRPTAAIWASMWAFAGSFVWQATQALMIGVSAFTVPSACGI